MASLTGDISIESPGTVVNSHISDDFDTEMVDVISTEDTERNTANATNLDEPLSAQNQGTDENCSDTITNYGSTRGDVDHTKFENKNDVESKGKHATRLPLSRIKNIMKMDEDCSIISQDAVFLVTKATEIFIESITRDTMKFLTSSKRKTMSKKDIDSVIDSVPHLCFLDGIFE